MAVSQTTKVAVVTGASSGIGAVYADRLAARGYDLILIARREGRLRELAKRILADHGRRADVVVADLESADDLVIVERLIAASPNVHVLVNNAGLARLTKFETAPLQDAVAQISLNITALTRLTHAVLPGLIARNQGAVINIGSVLGIHSLPISAVYSGTKAYVLAFSQGLEAELQGTGVRIQVVLPAATATEVWDHSGVPLETIDPARVMNTEDLVDAALAGFDDGETVTWPSVADGTLWKQVNAAQASLFSASQTSKPAPRYRITSRR